jgi:minor capsid protein
MVWHGPKVEHDLDGKVPKALKRAAEHLLEEANRTVPLLEGTLMRSGTATADDKTATVAYDTPYCRRQHEHLEYRHPGGRRAKWLERTFQERASAVSAWLAEEIKGAF